MLSKDGKEVYRIISDNTSWCISYHTLVFYHGLPTETVHNGLRELIERGAIGITDIKGSIYYYRTGYVGGLK